jgi:hypothetical protein
VVKLVLQEREYMEAQEIALEKRFEVRRIIPVFNAVRVQVGKDFVTGGEKEGTNDAESGSRLHGLETGRSGTPYDPEQHFFGLVVCGVSESNLMSGEGLFQLFEKKMPAVPCGHFDREPVLFGESADVAGGDAEIEPRVFRDTPDEFTVCFGFAPSELMVEVDDGDASYSQDGFEVDKDVQEGHRVRASRNRRQDMVPGCYQAVLPDVFGCPVRQFR